MIIRLHDPVDFSEWRDQARVLLAAAVAPEAVTWINGHETSLFDEAPAATAAPSTGARVPRTFLDLANTVLAHSDPQRHGLLYRVLWRLAHGEPQLLQLITDADMLRLRAMEKSVRRDTHKMKAFVRFREVAAPENSGSVFIAWFEPKHYIVERVAPFFMRRFAGMHWSILTPYRSAHWDGETLKFAEGANKSEAPDEDALEDLWRTYYANIFNPARLKIKAMTSEMPVKYWKNLPEARLIPGLIREAMPRAQEMVDKPATTPRKRIAPALPQAPTGEALEAGSLEQLRSLALDCRRCELWKQATRTVFGEGPKNAQVMFIGEQPGDQEDLAGKPFIGPAGKLLNRALEQAGLDRQKIYVTNTVKHFKFEPRGKQRLHKRADSREQAACRPWLEAELAQVQPEIVVCLGAMAAQAVFGSEFQLLKERGRWRELGSGIRAFATVHPSFLLRLPDQEARERGFDEFVRDLKLLVATDL